METRINGGSGGDPETFTRIPKVPATIRAARRKAFEQLPADATTADVLRGLYGPILECGGRSPRSKGARALLVLNQIRQDPSEEARAIIQRHEDDLAVSYGVALARALGCTVDEAHRMILYVNGAAWDAATQAVLSSLNEGAIKIDVDLYLDLMAAGMHAVAGRKEK